MSTLKKIIVEEIDNYMNEVGEASAKSFNFQYRRVNPPNSTYDESVYEFITDKGTNYEVSILKKDDEAAISFFADDDDDLSLTNKNEVYSVMTTVVNIIKDFDQKIAKPENINKLSFNPVDKDSESSLPIANANSRTKLYSAYVSKHIGHEFTVNTVDGGTKIVLTRK